MNNEIEIPFGALDSELMHQEISIPEGFTATIEGNKIILTRTESEDERIRKEIINYFQCQSRDEPSRKHIHDKWIDWLEKQGEQKSDNIDNKFIRMRETKPKDISEFLDRLTTVEQEFLWEHIAKIRELDKEEQKPAWSEEDDIMVRDILGWLPAKSRPEYNQRRVDWLKSLKDRNLWKPSEEQITVLELASKYERVFTPKQIDILIGLKEQLKKLKA